MFLLTCMCRRLSVTTATVNKFNTNSVQFKEQCLHLQRTMLGSLYRSARGVTTNSSVLDHVKYTPRRAMLYVPGNDIRKLNKISKVNVDCAVMDCEDGVALNQKTEARETIKRMVDELDVGERTEKAVRINSVDSGLAEEDLKVILEAAHVPRCIMVPKVEGVEHIQRFSQLLSELMKQKRRAPTAPVTHTPSLVLFVESARSLIDLDHICKEAHRLARDDYRLEGLVFGSDDFCASIGATRSENGSELLYARQKFVTVAKAHNLQAIDMVHINYKDLDGLRHQSALGAQMGFTGKQVIHPGQVDIVQQAFSPTEERVAWAQGLIQAFTQHQKHGKGAFVYEGCMIDKPLLLQAQHIVAMAGVVGSSKNG